MPPQDQEGKPKRVDVHDNKDGTYTVTYVPDKTGRYTIGVKYGGDEIPSSPYRIRASPAGDASKCSATGRIQVLSVQMTWCELNYWNSIFISSVSTPKNITEKLVGWGWSLPRK